MKVAVQNLFLTVISGVTSIYSTEKITIQMLPQPQPAELCWKFTLLLLLLGGFFLVNQNCQPHRTKADGFVR